MSKMRKTILIVALASLVAGNTVPDLTANAADLDQDGFITRLELNMEEELWPEFMKMMGENQDFCINEDGHLEACISVDKYTKFLETLLKRNRKKLDKNKDGSVSWAEALNKTAWSTSSTKELNKTAWSPGSNIIQHQNIQQKQNKTVTLPSSLNKPIVTTTSGITAYPRSSSMSSIEVTSVKNKPHLSTSGREASLRTYSVVSTTKSTISNKPDPTPSLSTSSASLSISSVILAAISNKPKISPSLSTSSASSSISSVILAAISKKPNLSTPVYNPSLSITKTLHPSTVISATEEITESKFKPSLADNQNSSTTFRNNHSKTTPFNSIIHSAILSTNKNNTFKNSTDLVSTNNLALTTTVNNSVVITKELITSTPLKTPIILSNLANPTTTTTFNNANLNSSVMKPPPTTNSVNTSRTTTINRVRTSALQNNSSNNSIIDNPTITTFLNNPTIITSLKYSTISNYSLTTTLNNSFISTKSRNHEIANSTFSSMSTTPRPSTLINNNTTTFRKIKHTSIQKTSEITTSQDNLTTSTTLNKPTISTISINPILTSSHNMPTVSSLPTKHTISTSTANSKDSTVSSKPMSITSGNYSKTSTGTSNGNKSWAKEHQNKLTTVKFLHTFPNKYQVTTDLKKSSKSTTFLEKPKTFTKLPPDKFSFSQYPRSSSPQEVDIEAAKVTSELPVSSETTCVHSHLINSLWLFTLINFIVYTLYL